MKWLAWIALVVASSVNAQYPNKPVRVLVGYAAGSSTDIVGRVMADRLGAYWKQSVYVETRAGAAGNLAADAAAKAPGKTDLLPLAPVAATPHILIVAPDFAAKSVQELIARARAEPGRLAFASSGVGNSDVMAGRIAYYFAGMPVGLPLAKSGKVRALAVTGKRRFAGAPDIPTVAEQGLPDYEATLWQGFFAPASIAPELAARIAADIQKVLALPETREKLQGAGVSLFEASHAEFKRFFPAEIEKWRGVVKKANLKFD